MDAYALCLLAVYLTFHRLYRLIMMVLRICVQRFERFPQLLSVDVREFHSVYYAYEVYDQNEHSSLGMSPQAAYLWGIGGGRTRTSTGGIFRPLFEKYLPHHDKREALVQKGSGIKVNRFYYWNNEFRNPEIIKTAVPVRRSL